MDALTQEIRQLAKERDAVILAHYYVDGSIQDIADYVGDSFYLAKVAKEDPHQTIVFCGVTFMGESACLLNPDKTVLMPDLDAVCPMALMVDEEEIAQMRAKYDDLAVVCYINSMAASKNLVDVCVTSSNALKVVRKLPQKNIFFIPDKNLGHWIAEQVPEKNFLFSKGYCPVHNEITLADVKVYQNKYPDAEVLVHPECPLDVTENADFAGSTSEIIDYAGKSDSNTFIVCTESGVAHELKKRYPNKSFHFILKGICPDMRNMKLEQVANALRTNSPKAYVDDAIREGAKHSLDLMLEMAR